MFKLRKLDRYILTEVSAPFLGGVLFFTFIFLMFQILRLAEFFIIHGVPLTVLGRMVGYLVLTFLPTALPVAFLIGMLAGFGRLSSDSELIAMKANGMSLMRLTMPALILAIVVSILSLALNLEWVPWAHRGFKDALIRVSKTKVASSIKEGTFTTGFYNLLVYADQLDKKTNRLSRVFIYDEREPKNPLTVIAKEGEIVPIRTDTELGSATVMKLYNGSIHRNDATTQVYQKINFGQYELFLKIDESEADAATKPGMYTYKALKRTIAKTKKQKKKRELKAEFWRRYAVAISPMVFVFLGVGFGSVRTRSVRAGAMLISFVVVLLYWILQTIGTVAAQKGYLPPFLAMQMANLLFLPVAVLGFRSANW